MHRRVRAIGFFAVTAVAAACRHPRPFGDVPGAADGRTTAIFTLRAAECDGNLSALTVFDLPAVRAGVVLAGVALVDGDSAEPRLRAQMRAYDVTAPVLRLAADTRDSIGRLTAGLGPTILVLERGRRDLTVLRAPHNVTQLQDVEDSLVAIAARAPHLGRGPRS